jgi:hypothetical protein
MIEQGNARAKMLVELKTGSAPPAFIGVTIDWSMYHAKKTLGLDYNGTMLTCSKDDLEHLYKILRKTGGGKKKLPDLKA